MFRIIGRWEKAPKGSKCLKCGEETLERWHNSFCGAFGGRVRCTNCDYTDSSYAYLGKSCITVEPLNEKEIKNEIKDDEKK